MTLTAIGGQYFNAYDSHDAETTAVLTNGLIVEGFATQNESSFSFDIRDAGGTITHQATVALDDAHIFPILGQHVGMNGAVAALVGGGFVCAVGTGGPGGQDVFVRTFDNDGNPTSDYIRVTDASAGRYFTGVTATADGGFTVTWNDDANENTPLHYPNGDPTIESWDMLARHYKANGHPDGPAFFAQASGNDVEKAEGQRNGMGVGLDDGSVAYVYIDTHRVVDEEHGLSSFPYGISMFLHGNEIHVNNDFDTFNFSGIVFSSPQIVKLSSGAIAVSWLENNGSGPEWHGAVYKPNGTVVTPDTILVSETDFNNGTYKMAAMDNGQFALLYTTRDAGDGSADVKLSTFDTHGNLLDTTVVSDAPNHQVASNLTYLGDGGLLASWSDGNAPQNGSYNAYFVESTVGEVIQTGGGGDDAMGGGAKNDWLDGHGGNDSINGLGGNDRLWGSNGDDTLNGGDGNDHMFGGAGKDKLIGGAGANRMVGGADADKITMGADSETVGIGAASDSMSKTYDTVSGFDFRHDRFDLPFTVVDVNHKVTTGTLSKGSFDVDLANALDATHLSMAHAVLFQPDAGNLAGTSFLVIDANGIAGYQAGQDIVIGLDSAVSLNVLSAVDFI